MVEKDEGYKLRGNGKIRGSRFQSAFGKAIGERRWGGTRILKLETGIFSLVSILYTMSPPLELFPKLGEESNKLTSR